MCRFSLEHRFLRFLFPSFSPKTEHRAAFQTVIRVTRFWHASKPALNEPLVPLILRASQADIYPYARKDNACEARAEIRVALIRARCHHFSVIPCTDESLCL